MKLFAALMLLSTSIFAQPYLFSGQIHKTVTTAGTPLQLSSTAILVKQVCFVCSFSNTGTACYVGNSATNAVAAKAIVLIKPTATVPAQPVCLGDLSNGAGPKVDLSKFYVDVGTNNDEVNAFYWE